MLIILEGNECCFQSNFAYKLRNKCGYNMEVANGFEVGKIKKNIPYEEGQERLYRYFLDFLQKDYYKENAVLDGFFITNLAYANVYDGYYKLSDEQIDSLIRKLNSLPIIHIYLYDNPDKIISRLCNRKDDKKQKSKKTIVKINKAFKKINKKYTSKIRNNISIDVGRDSSVECFKSLACMGCPEKLLKIYK